MIGDLHVHSVFSTDSEAQIEAYLNKAIGLGMKEIAITDHQDFDYLKDTPDHFDPWFDTDQYFETLTGLRDKFCNKINLLIGVELGLQPHLAEKLHSYVSRYPFDFVLGSTHLAKRHDPCYPDFWEDFADPYCTYFEAVKENISKIDDIDAVAHVDFAIRSGRKRKKQPFASVEKYRDEIDEFLKVIVEKSKALEINTDGFSYDPNSVPDSIQILKRFQALGGEMVTVGSDCHQVTDLGRDFQKARQYLLSAGFQYYTVFENRQPVFKKL